MTITELFLLCSSIDEYTEFVVFDDYDSYLFNMAPIAVTCFDYLNPEITKRKIHHFKIDDDIVYVEVA